MAFQQKAVLMSERVNGIDHAYTISEYVSRVFFIYIFSKLIYLINVHLILKLLMFFQTHLALYCFANSQITTALKLLYRARYLTLLVCGENHPEMGVLDVS